MDLTIASIIATVVGSALSIVASYHSTRRSGRQDRPRKSLMYEVVVNVGIDRHNEVISDMRKWFDRRRRRQVILGIRNDGIEAIVEADYRRDVEFNFGEGSTVQRATVVESVPTTIRPKLMFAGGQLFIKPTMLNPGEFFVVSVVVKACGGLKEDFRLAGTQVFEFHERKPLALRLSVFIPVLLVGYAVSAALWRFLHVDSLIILMTFAALTAWPILSGFFSIVFSQKRRTRRWLPPNEALGGPRRIG